MRTPETPFVPAPKTPRLSRECLISEKIDGTRSTIFIDDAGELFCGSRNRWITPENDNYGFAKWCEERKEELLKLGPGRHDGEFWGAGIQRRYNMPGKRFSLFNAQRWTSAAPTVLADEWRNTLPGVVDTDGNSCACASVVPILYRGPFSTGMAEAILAHLAAFGSVAAPGFKTPEGIIIHHVAARISFKKTLDGDEAKGLPSASELSNQ